MNNVLKYVFYLSLNKVEVCALIYPVSCSNNIKNKCVGKKGKKKITFIKQTVSEVYYLTDGTISKTN